MAILSSHLLNAITGEHAGDVKITLSNLDRNTSKIILKTNTDEGGRLSENIEIKLYRSCEFEMIIAIEDYFKKKNPDKWKDRIISDVVIRFKMKDDNKKYHIPLIISPNGYSVWWSE